MNLLVVMDGLIGKYGVKTCAFLVSKEPWNEREERIFMEDPLYLIKNFLLSQKHIESAKNGAR